MGDVVVAFGADSPRVQSRFVILKAETGVDDRVAVEAWHELGTIQKSAWSASRVVTVESSEPYATDAEIAQLVEATRDYLEAVPAMVPSAYPSMSAPPMPGAPILKLPAARREKLAKLVDRLAPVQAPTLAETLDALRVLANEGAVGVHLNAATRLLDRARRAGVMP